MDRISAWTVITEYLMKIRIKKFIQYQLCLHKILNLDMTKKITKDDVNKAYIKIQKKIHPDVSPETTRLSSIVNEAKDLVLNDIS